VLGVSRYESQPSLPGCDHDATAIRTILTEAGFDLVFTPTATTAAIAKEQIGDFVKKHQKTEVNEFLVFFSGHGDIIDDDFRYVLSDFDEGQPNATTISHVQLDGWARSLTPQLFVKIVDACHSGSRYI
jgi:uncharacterized caspase-like protein